MFKSMLCSLASSGRLEAPRRYRFPDRYCDDISTLVETVTKDIVIGQARESREVPRVSGEGEAVLHVSQASVGGRIQGGL